MSPMPQPVAPLLHGVRQFLSSRQPRPQEACEMCGVAIAAEHGHVVNSETRGLLCVCRPCYLLFTQEAGGRFRAVPDRYQAVEGFSAASAEWDRLQIPIGMAFLFMNSALDRMVAIYPSAGGPTEAELPLAAWDDLSRALPELRTLQPDVEALLVRRFDAADRARDRDAGPDLGFSQACAFIVPIDACYELTGRLRRHWQGFQGGRGAWRAVDAFFARVESRARLGHA